jgi:enolase-phosphatase E1
MTRPLELHVRCALLDIEGTVADIRFVYNVMFPFVREHLRAYLINHWDSPELLQVLGLLAIDAGLAPDNAPWFVSRSESAADRSHAIDQAQHHVHELMDSDSKTTGLKALQGLIWESGFRSGALRAELFDDVVPALEKWKAHGINLKIYSSGSILAQKLFFGHTTHGDLTPFFSAYFDTTTGSKREAASYDKIARASKIDPSEIVFFTDVFAEIDAAVSTGMHVVAVVRPNNAPLPESYHGHRIHDLSAVELRLP